MRFAGRSTAVTPRTQAASSPRMAAAAVLLLAVSFLAAVGLRFRSGWLPVEDQPALAGYSLYFLLSAAAWLLFASRYQLGPKLCSGYPLARWCGDAAKTSLFALALTSIAAFFWRDYSYSRLTVGLFWVLHVGLCAGAGAVFRRISGLDGQGRLSHEFWLAGDEISGELGPQHGPVTIRRWRDTDELLRQLRRNTAPAPCVALSPSQISVFPEVFRELDRQPDASAIWIAGPNGTFLETPVGPCVTESFDYAVVKRTFDFVAAAAALIALAPVFAAVAAVTAVRLGRPVLISQERIGRHGRRFRLWKFRTLPRAALAESDRQWIVEPSDRWAAFLRATGLDELPQLWHVMRGEMSLVGPRPERPYFVERFQQEWPFYSARHRLQAGITGWAQTHGWRGDTSIARRVEYDLYYLRHWSLALDLRILARTGAGFAASVWRFARGSG